MKFYRNRRKTNDTGLKNTALENAWKIHDAQGNWTNRVDAKAAFAFTIQSAAIATAISLTPNIEILKLYKPSLWFFLTGIGALIIGVILAALVVIPRLRQKRLANEAASNFIYFGHARQWDPEKLKSELLQDDMLSQLSLQIVTTAKIAWVKHQRVKWSFVFALSGLLSLSISSLLLLNA